ncbi:serine hydrolase domain-containing protein [Flavihumibacter sp. UBA7668]|uniref:serine hydrolase domain-containing protein n=1 Tax=Flavihumibacter sp. UBA7668 TaxID=1946542 RepID=UPI0025C01F80|nr:serine hydrolase domain-containing protein [Flavihumibacter sp. UBA7668]
MFYQIRILLIFVCALPLMAAYSQNTDLTKLSDGFAEVDKLFTEFAAKSNNPGFVYGIVANGKLVHLKFSGMANREKKSAVNPESVFRIASMSKSFAGVAILQLRDQGRLQLDEPAHLYIPELVNTNYLTTDASPITIRQLMTHAAGFPEDNPWGDRQLGISDEEMHAMFKKGISYSTVPGTAYEYSNMGFAMLGAIIKKVSGMSYQEYIQQYIWKPIGMFHTYWEYADVPDSTLAIGYRWINDDWVAQPLEHDGAYGIMGGILTTAEDFARYMSFMLGAWPARNEPDNGPLKRSSLREMQHPWNFAGLNPGYKYPDGRTCPISSGYGYGLRWSSDCDGRVTVGHSGGLPGFGSNWAILPDYGIGIVSFINQTYAPASRLNTEAIDLLIKKTGLQPRNIQPSPILIQRQKELTAFLPDWKNAEKSESFAENFFLDYLIDSLRKESAELFRKAGKIIRTGEMKPENNLRGTFILYGEKANIRIYFTLSPETPAKIQEFRIRMEK